MRCSVLMMVAVITVVTAGCETSPEVPGFSSDRGSQPSEEPQINPTASLDDEPLLLLDDGPDASAPPEEGADNSRCFVCHMNYVQEDIAVIHARAFIGCADCHGESDAHIDDESWASGGTGTAPDTMYLREEVNPFCMGCHPKNTIDTVQHKALFAGTSEQKYCTDCHGEHRLAHRRCKWK